VTLCPHDVLRIVGTAGWSHVVRCLDCGEETDVSMMAVVAKRSEFTVEARRLLSRVCAEEG